MKKLIILLLVCLSPFSAAWAAKQATDGKVDPRIKHVIYNQRDVVVLNGHYGYSTHVVFAPDEEILHLSPGDSLAWQILPKQNHLFLKPMENNAETNLSVLTNQRMYQFELRANEATGPSDPTLTFTVMFSYPEDELAQAMLRANVEEQRRSAEVLPDRRLTGEEMNFEYSRRGSDIIAPTRVFDDGEFTYFQFPPEIDTPAIFLVYDGKEEALVNFHVRGRYVVVQRIASQFILRNGAQATCIYNDAFNHRNEPSELPEVAKASK